MGSEIWLSTGKAARILGTSRQHVVDLCDSGRLPFVKVGTHRRIDALALEAFLLLPQRKPPLRREQLVSLWLHHAVAGRLVRNPKPVMDRARRNLAKLSKRHPSAQPWIQAWRHALDQGPDELLQLLTSLSEASAELRQNSPFAGVLPPDERRRVLASFYAHGRGQPAA